MARSPARCCLSVACVRLFASVSYSLSARLAARSRELVDHPERHSRSSRRADITIRGGKAVARNVFGAVQLIFKRMKHPFLRAIADHHGALHRHDDLEGLVGVGRFDRSRAEE